MIEKEIYETFKRGSKTYFYNSIFFPRPVKRDVFSLYSFVRQADNLVDSIPQKAKEFKAFCDRYERSYKGENTGDVTIDHFTELAHRKGFEKGWIDGFLDSMSMDLTKNRYEDIGQTMYYIYGSAEVIGLMMSRILDLDRSFDSHARSLGKAMQYINFIRDINEDDKLGRIYFPIHELEDHGLSDLSKDSAYSNRRGFLDFMQTQVDRYRKWQMHAEEGYSAIPKMYLIPISSASDMYNWTADKIRRDPFIVYKKKVKPSKARIFLNVARKHVVL